VRARLVGDEAERATKGGVEDVAYERRLARPAHAGDDAHAPNGDPERHVLQVVGGRADELDPPLRDGAHRALDARRLREGDSCR